MTEEEIEVEEYTKHNATIFYDARTDNPVYDDTEEIKQAWKDGAKWEKEHKWHDLRKNPNDLPKRTGKYFTNIGLLYYDELCNRHFWHTPSCEACDYSDEVEEDEVIAWCELPKFKE